MGLEVFNDQLYKIANPGIRAWTKQKLKETPEHFWTDPASFSGKFHNGESRVEHIKRACVVGEHLLTLYALTPLEADCVRSAIILHDCATFNDGGHVNADHAEIMAANMRNVRIADATISDEARLDIADAVEAHMAWWGTRTREWRFDNFITIITILADYISTRNGISVEI
jgi:hypothetical protein